MGGGLVGAVTKLLYNEDTDKVGNPDSLPATVSTSQAGGGHRRRRRTRRQPRKAFSRPPTRKQRKHAKRQRR